MQTPQVKISPTGLARTSEASCKEWFPHYPQILSDLVANQFPLITFLEFDYLLEQFPEVREMLT